jgi:hypothetical protein
LIGDTSSILENCRAAIFAAVFFSLAAKIATLQFCFASLKH